MSLLLGVAQEASGEPRWSLRGLPERGHQRSSLSTPLSLHSGWALEPCSFPCLYPHLYPARGLRHTSPRDREVLCVSRTSFHPAPSPHLALLILSHTDVHVCNKYMHTKATCHLIAGYFWRNALLGHFVQNPPRERWLTQQPGPWVQPLSTVQSSNCELHEVAVT